MSKEKITKETAYKNVVEWLYVNDGKYEDKNKWRAELLTVIRWNFERVA